MCNFGPSCRTDKKLVFDGFADRFSNRYPACSVFDSEWDFRNSWFDLGATSHSMMVRKHIIYADNIYNNGSGFFPDFGRKEGRQVTIKLFFII
jgi:hypothetical protein